jgi:hypothetical protein
MARLGLACVAAKLMTSWGSRIKGAPQSAQAVPFVQDWASVLIGQFGCGTVVFLVVLFTLYKI